MRPMNLLYIMSDHHSRDKLGCCGNPHICTPNLDALAANGVAFDNAYCNNPICVPSRASMATGDYGFRDGFWDNCHPYDGRREGWGHRLVQQGHKVTTIGKLHYKNNSPETGFPDQRIPMHLKNGVGNVSICIRDMAIKRPHQRDAILNAGAGDSEYLRYDAEVARLAAEFLRDEAAADGKPWCLYVGFVCPHFPLTVPEELLDLYRPFDKLPFPSQWAPGERPMHPAIQRFREIACTDDGITDDALRKAVACYYALTTYMDIQVGVVLDALRDSGLADSTRIIYTSDHGDSLGDHAVFFKNNMYEGSVGVPLIIAGPDIPRAMRVGQCASLVDIFPSVLECVGAEKKPEDERLPGASLWQYALGERADDRPIFAESHTFFYERAVFMIRYKRYKMVWYMQYQPQLFDVENDPGELRDLAADPAYAGVMEDLQRCLREICDLESVDRAAQADQQKVLDRHGGKEKVLRDMGKHFFAYSPPPAIYTGRGPEL